MEEMSDNLLYFVNLSVISFEDFIKVENIAAKKARKSKWQLFAAYYLYCIDETITISLN